MKHLHILGICGTFMASLAILAQELGFKVTGSDKHVYPPMSELLKEHNIPIISDYNETTFPVKCDMVIIGNALSRGTPIIEAMLNEGLYYQSGPEWLAQNILRHKWVLCVAGTHGKTTTSSLLAWILQHAKLSPGFLIGGVCPQLYSSAKLGQGNFFVIEGDEYDTAFFDKRSKFIHYRPKTLILNNLEFDHADIFASLGDIQCQMHHLIRMVPENGQIIYNDHAQALKATLEKGTWSKLQPFGISDFTDATWQVKLENTDGSQLSVFHQGKKVSTIHWNLLGEHNAQNALAAIIAAYHIGIPVEKSAKALAEFNGIKRRLELIGSVNNIYIYDDFAHHPTAIKTTIASLKAKIAGKGRVIAVFEPRSNTMKMGIHGQSLVDAFKDADSIWALSPQNISWDIKQSFSDTLAFSSYIDINKLISGLKSTLMPEDHVIIMSNGSFGGIHQKLLATL